MTGLALEGGGLRGAYQAGAYMAFLECNIKIDGVCGTSVGALNGAVIACNKGNLLPDIWRNNNMGSIFGFTKDYVEAINSNKINLSYFKSLILNIITIIKNKGIELKGVKELIDKEIDVNNLINSDIDFGLITLRLKDFEPICLFKKDMDLDKIKEYIVASCYLPVFKMEKLIDDNYYLDGGFYDVAPVNMLLDKGYDTVYLIKNQGIGIHRKYDKSKNIIVIEPKRSLGGIFDIDSKRIDENIKMGYYDTLRVLKKLDGYNYVFKVKKERYYKWINRKVNKYDYRRVKKFFRAHSYKDTTIKAIEYIMEREEYNYYQIWDLKKVLKKVKKKCKNSKHFIDIYVQNLRFFF